MTKQNKHVIYWKLFTFNDWEFIIAATERGLCYVGSENKSFDELVTWGKKRYPESQLIESEQHVTPYTIQLQEYFTGERSRFTIPLDYRGTDFQMAVWESLRHIPIGEKWTYTDVANDIYHPKAVRAVGTAIGANPLLIVIPCHRVVGKDGSLTGYRGGLEMKVKLLQFEQRK